MSCGFSGFSLPGHYIETVNILNALAQKFFGIPIRVLLSRKSMLQYQRLAGLGSNKIIWLLGASPHYESFSEKHKELVLSNFRSQLGQDVHALSLLGPNKKGFFVEFGATNGVDLSNTFLLERMFGWRGILCEPAAMWRDQLAKNRSASIDSRCVFSESGLLLSFLETSTPELSTLKGFGESDYHAGARQSARSYDVETVSLLDLLREHRAPSHIDFLSIDTEGSELRILNAFDFSQYTFGLIVVEHNYTSDRNKIQALLESKGYRQLYPELSDFDDWFVPESNQTVTN